MNNNNIKLYENLALTNSSFNKNFIKNFKKILSTGMYINGTFRIKLEQKFAEFIGTNYSVGVSNGLDGLILALNTLKILKKKQKKFE